MCLVVSFFRAEGEACLLQLKALTPERVEKSKKLNKAEALKATHRHPKQKALFPPELLLRVRCREKVTVSQVI